MRKTKAKKGFTLVETVIAVAVLAVCSVLILRMFVLSQNTENKAKDLNRAVTEAQTAVEAVKACPASEKLGALLPKSSVTVSGGGFVLERWYAKDWTAAAAPTKDGYTLRLTASPDGAGGLSLSVTVVREKPYPLEKGTERELYSLSARAYGGAA